MASKILLISLVSMIFPMMFIPGIALKFPPMYQIFFILLILIAGLGILVKGKVNRELLKYLLLLIFFCIYLYFNGSQFSQIISIFSYILILIVLRFAYPKTVFLNRKKINRIFDFLYLFFLSYAIIQIVAYYLFEIEYLVDFSFYLTSEIYSTFPSPPTSGWNNQFRPSSFFAEPSFLGFYIALYSIYRIDNKYKFPFSFLFANILILHILGNRSGEVILIFMMLYILFDKKFGKKTSLTFFSIAMFLVFFFGYYFSTELFENITYKNTDGSIVERVRLFILGLQIYQDNIFFGIGLGNIGDYVWVKNNLYFFPVMNLTNMYVQFLTEVGTIGFVILIIYFIKLFSYSYSTIALLMAFFLIGGYALFYIFLFSLFNSIYLQESYSENFISK